ncbi:MAG: hypothetical protein KAR38_03645 [Calditrichia bacterium]|nr:hypothetical protein [Calditrichia bacterium]
MTRTIFVLLLFIIFFSCSEKPIDKVFSNEEKLIYEIKIIKIDNKVRPDINLTYMENVLLPFLDSIPRIENHDEKVDSIEFKLEKILANGISDSANLFNNISQNLNIDTLYIDTLEFVSVGRLVGDTIITKYITTIPKDWFENLVSVQNKQIFVAELPEKYKNFKKTIPLGFTWKKSGFTYSEINTIFNIDTLITIGNNKLSCIKIQTLFKYSNDDGYYLIERIWNSKYGIIYFRNDRYLEEIKLIDIIE